MEKSSEFRSMVIFGEGQAANRFPYTFLHGELEEKVGFDCFSVEGFEAFGFVGDGGIVTHPQKREGIFPCSYDGRRCLLFLWVNAKWAHYCGLACYFDDIEAVEFCFKTYREKPDTF